MKISIIIPAFNEEDRISAAIASALAQDYPDFEVIVVNNASTDDTERIARSFEGIKVVNENKKGLTFARERGRLEAGGELIANMDADCIAETDWLSKGAKFFENPKVVAVSGPYDYFDGPARLRSFYLWYQKYIQSLKLMNFLMGRGINGGWITGGNAFIRAEALHKTRGYDTSFEFWGEDTVTAKRLAKVGHVIYSKDLVMKSSARRFVAPGSNVLKVIWKYLDNRF